MDSKNISLPFWMGKSLKNYWSERAKNTTCEDFIYDYVQKMIVNNFGSHWGFVDFLGLKPKTELDKLYELLS